MTIIGANGDGGVKVYLHTPIFSRDFANTSQPFFWLTKIMIGGSKPCDRTSRSFFLLPEQKKNASEIMETHSADALKKHFTMCVLFLTFSLLRTSE